MVQTKGRAAEVFPGITMDPEVRFGKPCITGTRIDVATVIGAIAAGESIEAVEQAVWRSGPRLWRHSSYRRRTR